MQSSEAAHQNSQNYRTSTVFTSKNHSNTKEKKEELICSQSPSNESDSSEWSTMVEVGSDETSTAVSESDESTLIQEEEIFEFDPVSGPSNVKAWFDKCRQLVQTELNKTATSNSSSSNISINPHHHHTFPHSVHFEEDNNSLLASFHHHPQANSTFLANFPSSAFSMAASSADSSSTLQLQQEQEQSLPKLNPHVAPCCSTTSKCTTSILKPNPTTAALNNNRSSKYNSTLDLTQLDFSGDSLKPHHHHGLSQLGKSSSRFNEKCSSKSVSTENLCNQPSSSSSSLPKLQQQQHQQQPPSNNLLNANLGIRKLRRSISLIDLNKNMMLKYYTKSNNGSSGGIYTSAILTSYKLDALIHDILIFIKKEAIQIPNLSSSASAGLNISEYKKLFGDQYLGLCITILSKIIDVNYGEKREDQISMILEVSKSFECPIKMSKSLLINPMSSSAINSCTLFLHWICMRVSTFLTEDSKESSELINNDENDDDEDAFSTGTGLIPIETIHSAYSQYLKTGVVNISSAIISCYNELARLIYGNGNPDTSQLNYEPNKNVNDYILENKKLEEYLRQLRATNEATRKEIEKLKESKTFSPEYITKRNKLENLMEEVISARKILKDLKLYRDQTLRDKHPLSSTAAAVAVAAAAGLKHKSQIPQVNKSSQVNAKEIKKEVKTLKLKTKK